MRKSLTSSPDRRMISRNSSHSNVLWRVFVVVAFVATLLDLQLSLCSHQSTFFMSVNAYYESTSRSGPEALKKGQELFAQGDYETAATELWRAVLLHAETPPSQTYNVQQVFTQFLQCYMFQEKIVDGLAFVALESFRRGQNDMGHKYLNEALSVDPNHDEALRIQEEYGSGSTSATASSTTSRPTKNAGKKTSSSNKISDSDEDDDTDDQDDLESFIRVEHPDLIGLTPEALYERASQHFSDKNYEECADLFELSCQLSNEKLGPSCANAVYCRTLILDWSGSRGYVNGSGFERDMQRIEELTRKEVRERRWPLSIATTKEKSDKNNVFTWQRATSTHPHMMLGYPLPALLKRYVAESAAFMDEKMARMSSSSSSLDSTPLTKTGSSRELPPLPPNLPYSIQDYRKRFQNIFRVKNDNNEGDDNSKSMATASPIRVGFVGSGFNSKAVLYLSHDMFRFFNESFFEVHVFSFGPADNPLFLQHGMRGVDWRQRVIANICDDCFHDLQRLQYNHIESARYIHDQNIHILIEWDGYARQGERAQGLFALRPAPIQILHQEYLGTSGALYTDYIISDTIASPPHLQHLYTEKIIYMPNHFFSKGHAFQAEVALPTHDYAPATKPYQLGTGTPQENECLAKNKKNKGAGEHPSFVFCNFNKFLKNNPQSLRSWIRILREVPNSYLCMLENPKEGVPYLRKFVHETTATVKAVKEGGGGEKAKKMAMMIPGDNNDGEDLNSRIHFLPWQRNPFDHQLRNKDFCNVMLDSFPYNGHTVAQDALYAGVPIVTRSDGDDMCSRVTTSANIVLGLEEDLNANNTTDYEDKAIRLATDTIVYQGVRTKLIDSCLQRNPMHPYWDVARYVKNFETGLQMVWQRFLDGQDPDHVFVEESDRATKGTYDDEILAHPSEGRPKGIQADNVQETDTSESHDEL